MSEELEWKLRDTRDQLADAWAALQDYLVSIGEDPNPVAPPQTPLGELIRVLRP